MTPIVLYGPAGKREVCYRCGREARYYVICYESIPVRRYVCNRCFRLLYMLTLLQRIKPKRVER